MLSGCAVHTMAYPGLREVQPQVVDHCERMGSISEMTDTSHIFPIVAVQQMQDRIRAKAAELGATHIVWEYRTDEAAAATAYRCAD